VFLVNTEGIDFHVFNNPESKIRKSNQIPTNLKTNDINNINEINTNKP